MATIVKITVPSTCTHSGRGVPSPRPLRSISPIPPPDSVVPVLWPWGIRRSSAASAPRIPRPTASRSASKNATSVSTARKPQVRAWFPRIIRRAWPPAFVRTDWRLVSSSDATR